MTERLAVIGVGLIGGSLALSLRAARACTEIVGYNRGTVHRRQALEQGLVDRMADTPAQAVAGAGLVVLAVPVGATGAVLAGIREALGPRAVVTDAGSVKEPVVAAARAHLGEAFRRFVPGHPIAGTENSGPAAARSDLFRGRQVCLTPVAETEPAAVARVADMWEAAGARVARLDPARHDEIFALTSHLPHALAYLLVDLVARDPELFGFTGGGFRDFSRIASSDPVMWRDIFLANRGRLDPALRAFGRELEAFRAALAAGDAGRLEHFLRRAKEARDQGLAGGEAGS